MRNYQNAGINVRLTAPVGGVVAGLAYLIGNLFVVAIGSAAAGLQFEGQCEGVVNLPKNATQAMAEGAAVFWDDAAKNVTTTVATNRKIGHVVTIGGKIAADTTVDIRLIQV